MESGRFMFGSAAPSGANGGGGGQMLLFSGSGGFLGGTRVEASVEDGWRKRPFLTALDEELLQPGDQMYGLDEQAPERKRRLTAEQVRALERSFEEEKRKLEPERKSELARQLGIAPRQVAVWFQNRRSRWKSKQLEQDFEALRAAHDELLAGRDALLADNNSLRSQVISLTEQLQAKESPAQEQTAASDTLHAAATRAALLKEGYSYAETNGSGVAAALGFLGGAHDSPESYFAGARSPPSSSDDDGSGEIDCAFLLADAILDLPAVERETTQEDEEAQLNDWAWFWN